MLMTSSPPWRLKCRPALKGSSGSNQDQVALIDRARPFISNVDDFEGNAARLRGAFECARVAVGEAQQGRARFNEIIDVVEDLGDAAGRLCRDGGLVHGFDRAVEQLLLGGRLDNGGRGRQLLIGLCWLLHTGPNTQNDDN